MQTAPGARWHRRSELVVELAVAVALFLVSAVGVSTELFYGPPQPNPVPAFILVALASGSLVLRRRRPWLVAGVVVAACCAYHVIGYSGLAIAMSAFVAAYSLGAYGTGRRALVGCGLLVAALWGLLTLPPNAQPWYSFPLTGTAFGYAWFAVLGAAARQRRLAAEEWARQADQTAQAVLAQRLAEERLHIARELHDVLAHTVSVISVQAGVALDALDDDIGAARAALHLVRAAARQAGPELRAAVRPLRTSDVDDPAESGAAGAFGVVPPAPRLDGLAELVAPARAAGLTATVRVEPGPDPLPHPVELTAFRIVQESVTNVLRHAKASTVDVSVVRAGELILVSVRDDGTGGSSSGAGLGIVGMRERAHLLGGTIEAGPSPAGGFAVVARLPVVPR